MSTLRRQLEERRLERQQNREENEPVCFGTKIDRSAMFIDFVLADGRIQGFPINHLLNYSFEPKGDAVGHIAGGSSEGAGDRLRLFFSTHDVTLTGYRLQKLLDPLRSGCIESIRALPGRYSNLRISASRRPSSPKSPSRRLTNVSKRRK